MTDVRPKPPSPSCATTTENSSARTAGNQAELTLVDSWPDHIPVTLAELEAIEIWLKPLLDEVFGGGDA